MRSDRRLIPNPAIVLDLGVNGLGVVRSLGRKGVRVLAVAFTEQGVAGCSRFCEAVDLPRDAGQSEFLSRLLALCQRLPAPPVLFPTSDESLALLSEHEQVLAPVARFVLPARRTMLDILNKDGTKRLAMECGVRIPATYCAPSFAHLCDMAPRMHYPVLFKPRNHYSCYLPGRAKNITFHEPDELAAYFAGCPQLADMGVFQEIIRGGDGHILVCAAYLNRDSEPLAVYTGRKIRQLQPDFGVTSYGISENLPEIAEMTVSFLQRMAYRGLVAVEYVEDRKTGQVSFLEINGRSYYHNALFLSCGVNLPWIAYLDAVRHPMLAREVEPRQKYGRKWVDLARDARSFRLKHKEGQLGWGPWLRSLTQARSFAVFAFDDLGPFWHGGRKLVWRQVRKRVNRIWAHAGRRGRVPQPR
jgi:D-aspartate ligase